MKKYLILCLLLLPVLLLSFVLPYQQSTHKTQPVKTDTSFNLLSAYGEYVFGREGCIRCHVLVDGTDPSKKSLDGMKGKYPSEWHFNHLIDPGMMVPESRMPSYRRLANREIDYPKLSGLYKKYMGEETAPDSSLILSLLQRSVQDLRETYFSIELEDKKYDNKEIMALVCWLQQIMPSASKQISDSIRNETANHEYARKLNLWKIWLMDHKSQFYQTANSRNKSVLDKAEQMFERYCSTCHGSQAQGKIGPNLTDDYWLNGNKIEELANTIRFGHYAMPPWEQVLSPLQISQLIAYIRSLKGSNPPNPKEPQGEKRSD
jgi:cytochrome c oxidase cbb3-type subunit III